MNAAKNTTNQIAAIRYADLGKTPTTEIYAHVDALSSEHAGNQISPADAVIIMHTLANMVTDITMGDLSSISHRQTAATIKDLARAMKTVLECREVSR